MRLQRGKKSYFTNPKSFFFPGIRLHTNIYMKLHQLLFYIARQNGIGKFIRFTSVSSVSLTL